MDAAVLMINNQRIPLAENADMGALISEVMTAVDEGGGFVHIDGQHGDAFDVLVTPATQVMVRYRTISFEAGSSAGPWTSTIDLDM